METLFYGINLQTSYSLVDGQWLSIPHRYCRKCDELYLKLVGFEYRNASIERIFKWIEYLLTMSNLFTSFELLHIPRFLKLYA